MSNICMSGIGVISSAGNSLNENWQNMYMGKSFINKIDGMNTDGLLTPNAGQIKMSDEEIFNSLTVKPESHGKFRSERGELLLFKAFEEALADSGIDKNEIKKRTTGLFIGTSLSGFTKLEKEYTSYIKEKTRISVTSYLSYPLHVGMDRLAYEYELSGPRFLFSTACSASLHTLIPALYMLVNGEIDCAIIGGVDPLSLMPLSGFSSLKSLASERCTPFSTGNLGLSIGEGAAVAFLEREESLEKRKKTDYYARVFCVNCTSDAYHPTAANPTGESIKKCINLVLESLNGFYEKKNILLMTHGTGTPHNDKIEMRAVKQVTGIENCKVSALKASIGHTLGASGMIEFCMLAACMKNKKVLPIAGFQEPRDGCNHNFIKSVGSDYDIDFGIKNAFAFGGNNVVAVMGSKKNGSLTDITPLYTKKETTIVITGIGLISAYNTAHLEEVIARMENGESAIQETEPVCGFNRSKTTKRAAVVDEGFLENLCMKYRIKNYRRMDKISKLAVAAAGTALSDAGLKVTSKNCYDIGLVSVTGSGPIHSVSKYYTDVITKGIRFANANVFPNTVVNAHAGYITIEYKIKGYTTVIAQGNSSCYPGAELAVQLIKSKRCKAVLLGSTSEYSSYYHRALIDIGDITNSPVMKIYDKETNGNIIGEGSVFFLLESLEEAEKRKAKIYCSIEDAKVFGSHTFAGTYRFAAVNPLQYLLGKKYHDTEIDIDCIYGEGTGIKQENMAECHAYKQTLKGIPITSATEYVGNIAGVKSFIHTALFASGHKSGFVPWLMNTTQPIYDNLLLQKKTITLNKALVCGLSAGGTAGYIMLKSI
jgi:3-oxoacyl-[acyl-carrier-protein] synthase II